MNDFAMCFSGYKTVYKSESVKPLDAKFGCSAVVIFPTPIFWFHPTPFGFFAAFAAFRKHLITVKMKLGENVKLQILLKLFKTEMWIVSMKSILVEEV